jgi:hypothetical protein
MNDVLASCKRYGQTRLMGEGMRGFGRHGGPYDRRREARLAVAGVAALVVAGGVLFASEVITGWMRFLPVAGYVAVVLIVRKATRSRSRRTTLGGQDVRPNVWGGDSGELFGGRLRTYLADNGIAGDVHVRPVKLDAAPPGAYLLTVDVAGGASVFFEVVDWADTVLVMDPNGADMTSEQAVQYLGLRVAGINPRQALRQVTSRA